jgi:hypothetical protein
VPEAELLAGVDAAFALTARGLARWADPHPDRMPRDEEYSRLLDPAKWRILGARADAWIVALADTGLALVERRATIRWRDEPATVISRAERVVPLVAGALPVVIARSRVGDDADAGVTLGVGDPAVCAGWFPECGCDACDSGSQDELDRLDEILLAVVAGRFRRLSSGRRTITVLDGLRWWATDLHHREVEAVLADPAGWDQLTGASWLPRE